MEHTRNHAVYGMEQAIEQRTILEKKITKIFIDCENTMAVSDVDQFKGHTGSAFHGIFVATGRTEPAMTAERNKFELSTVRTAVHGTTESRITAMNHLTDIFHLRFSGMKSIFNFLIIVSKNLL